MRAWTYIESKDRYYEQRRIFRARTYIEMQRQILLERKDIESKDGYKEEGQALRTRRIFRAKTDMETNTWSKKGPDFASNEKFSEPARTILVERTNTRI